MERLEKASLLLLVDALDRINKKVKNMPRFDDEVYIWCQSQAQDLGEYLEGAYLDICDVTKPVHALEEYYEHIYQLSAVESMEERNELADLIQKDLDECKRGIQENLPENG